MNVAVVAPAGTDTDVGTVTAALSLVRLIVSPAAGAALLIVTVPVDPLPLVTEVGLRVRAVKVGAVSVRFALRVVDDTVAVTVPLACVGTA